MRIDDIKGLDYKNQIVGIRLYINTGELWDIESSRFPYLGLEGFHSWRNVLLYERNGVLMSREEDHGGKVATDITDNYELLDKLRVVFSKARTPKDLAKINFK